MFRSALTALVAVCSAVALAATPSAGQSAAVSGNIMYFATAEPVANAEVAIGGEPMLVAETVESGAYGAEVSSGAVVIEPRKTGGYDDAVGPLDAAVVLKALVGMRTLSETESLACDVTGDGSISALDAAQILRFAVGGISRFPAAVACDSDWLFVPADTGASSLDMPQLAGGVCTHGRIVHDPLAGDVTDQDFTAILIGDCSGSWGQNGSTDPTPSPTPVPDTATPTPEVTSAPTETSTPTATFTSSWTPTRTPTFTRTHTSTRTHTRTRTFTPTRTFTRTPTVTFTITSTRTHTPTRTFTSTRTFSPTRTNTRTRTPTNTRRPTSTRTFTRTVTLTRTPTHTRTHTATRTQTFTRTHTITRTPTVTATPSPTPTAVCPGGLQWAMSPPVTISDQLGGALWLADAVATDDGWGLFWLRDDPAYPSEARLYYAHVDLAGEITHGPMLILQIPKITWRGRYYMAAWRQDHFAVLTAEQSSLYYHGVTKAGAVSGRRKVGPRLLYSSVWDSEADGDIDAYDGGFVAVVEGDCVGHSCSYAFKLDPDGAQTSSNVNLVDFDFTHQFYPRVVEDADNGFVILSVKDIKVASGGVMTKYWQPNGQMRPHVKVLPAKEYNWDEFPDLAYNGSHFAAIWTENATRQHGDNWQIRFAAFERSNSGGSPLSDKVLHGPAEKTLHRWTTRVHRSGNDWVVQYARRDATGENEAVFQLLDSDGVARATIAPFALTADALGSSPHIAAGSERTLGVVRGDNGVSSTLVSFYLLEAPSCQ